MWGYGFFIPVKAVLMVYQILQWCFFAGMFVVGAAMFHTGLAQKVGTTVVKMAGTGENSLMLGIMLVGSALSSVLSNTGTAAMLITGSIRVVQQQKFPHHAN